MEFVLSRVVEPIKRRRKNHLNIPTEIPTPTIEYFKRKGQTILTDIGCEWHLNNIHYPKPLTKKSRLIKKEQ